MRDWAWVTLLVVCANSGWAADAAKNAEPKTLTAAEMSPRAASVIFVGGMKVDKCWYEARATGAWINYDGQRFWYTKDTIQSVTYLAGEPDSDLQEWLRKSEDARKKEADRTAKADEDREKKAQESETPPVPPTTASAPTNVTSNPAAPGAQKQAEKHGGNEVSSANQNKGNAADNDNSGRRHVAGSGVVSGTGSGVGTGGIGVGGTGVGFVSAGLGAQWRVKDVDRKAGTVRLRNRLFHQYVTLKVKEPDDLKHVKVGQILEGMLSLQQPTLTTPDGTAVEFELSGLVPTP